MKLTVLIWPILIATFLSACGDGFEKKSEPSSALESDTTETVGKLIFDLRKADWEDWEGDDTDARAQLSKTPYFTTEFRSYDEQTQSFGSNLPRIARKDLPFDLTHSHHVTGPAIVRFDNQTKEAFLVVIGTTLKERHNEEKKQFEYEDAAGNIFIGEEEGYKRQKIHLMVFVTKEGELKKVQDSKFPLIEGCSRGPIFYVRSIHLLDANSDGQYDLMLNESLLFHGRR